MINLTKANKNAILLTDRRHTDFLSVNLAQSRFGKLNRIPSINRNAPFLLEGIMPTGVYKHKKGVYHHTEKTRNKIRKILLGRFLGSNSFSWKGGKCKNGAGYVYIYNPKHPFCTKQGYVREHRLIMEKHIGRYLHKWEIVHHINEIRDDNRVENLKLMGKSEHDRFEAFKKQFWKKKAKSC